MSLFTSPSLRRQLMQTSFLLAGGSALCAAPRAQADVYLVGAMLFAADSTGATTSTSYQYDTNTIHDNNTVSPLDLTFNGNTYSKGISLALAPGSNPFTFTEDVSTPLSAYGGTNGDLGLFFSSSNTPYNPSSGARTPDLLVSRTTDGSLSFFAPASGTTINDYIFPNTTTANGATSLTLGTSTIQIADYSVNDAGAGAFTVSISGPAAATPEPGSVALLAGLSLTGAGFSIRRRRGR